MYSIACNWVSRALSALLVSKKAVDVDFRLYWQNLVSDVPFSRDGQVWIDPTR